MGDVSYIRAVSYEVLKWFFYKTAKNEYETMSLVFLDPFLEKKTNRWNLEKIASTIRRLKHCM